MGTTPLKLEGSDGDLKEMSTSEENYVAYLAGLHLAGLAKTDVGMLTDVSTSNTNIGSYSNTFYNQAVGTHPGSSLSIGTTTTTVYQKTGSVSETGNRPFQWDDTLSGIQQMDDTDFNTCVDRLVSTIMTNEYPGTFRLGSASPGGDYSVFLSSIFSDTRADGTNVAYNIYQRDTMTAPTTTLPLKLINTFDIKEMTAAEAQTSFGQRAQNRIMSSTDAVGAYQLRSSAQGAPSAAGTWVARGTATDTRNTTTETAYTRDSNVDYTRLSTRNSTADYTANYTRTSTRTSQPDFTRLSTRTSQPNFTTDFSAVYTRNSTADFTRLSTRTSQPNFTTVFSAVYTRNSTSDFIGDFTGNFTGDFIADYTGDYTGNFLGDFIGDTNFTRISTRTSVRNRLGHIVIHYQGNPPGRPGNVSHTIHYHGDFAGNFTGDFVGLRHYSAIYTRNSILISQPNFTNIFTRNSTTTFTGDFAGNFTGDYTGDFIADYAGDFLGNFIGDFAGNFTGNYIGDFIADYAGNFLGNYVADYAGDFVGNFLGNYVGDFEGNFLGNYIGDFTGNFTGTTLSSSSTTVETYTLYVRRA